MGRADKSAEKGTQHNICSRRGHSRSSREAITSPAPEQSPSGTIGPATAELELPSGQTRGDEGPGRGEFAPPTPAPSADTPAATDIKQVYAARMAVACGGNGKPELHVVDPREIDPGPHNHRVQLDDEAFKLFCENLRAQGILEPLIVRSHPEKRGRYELLAGQRRLRAALRLDWKVVPVIIRELNDADAQLVTITENMQRQDLTPIEEGRNIEALLKLGMTVTEAAKQIGRSPAFISRRSRLPKVSDRWQKALDEPFNDISGWPAAMLELIAVLPAETQDALLKAQTNRGFKHADELRDYIQREHERQLAKAPWKLEAAGIAGVGPCSTCPKQTGNQPDLYPKAAKKGEKYARCLDANCFNVKANAWLIEHVAAVRKDDPQTKLVTTDWTQHRAEISEKLGAPVLEYYDFSPAQKNTPGAVKALVVNGPGFGTTRYVTLRERPEPQWARKPSAAQGRKQQAADAAAKRADAWCDALDNQIKVLTGKERVAMWRRLAPLTRLRLAAGAFGQPLALQPQDWRMLIGRSEPDAADVLCYEVLQSLSNKLSGHGTPELVQAIAKMLGLTVKPPEQPKVAESVTPKAAPVKAAPPPAAKAKPRKRGAAGRRAKKAAHKPRKLSRAGQIKILKR